MKLSIITLSENTAATPNLLAEQGLNIDTESGLVVILGCAHRGIINTVYHNQQLTGDRTNVDGAGWLSPH